MTTRTALQETVTAAGPLVLAAGTAMLTVALASSWIAPSQGQAALPRQTVTVTPPAASTPSAAAAARMSPSPDPRGQVLAAGPVDGQRPGLPRRGGRTDTGGQGEPDPTPSSPSGEPCPPGRIVSVTVSLGLLPCNAIQIGGRR